jgi:putative hemolysin
MKDRQQIIIVLTIIAIVILLGLALLILGYPLAPGEPSAVPPPPANLSPLARAYCNDLNFTYEVRTSPDGSEYGVCILPDGTVCDSWELYRGTCTAATSSNETIADPWGDFCLAMNYTYTIRENPEGGVDHVCVFPDGRECDARAYYLGSCNETTATKP